LTFACLLAFPFQSYAQIIHMQAEEGGYYSTSNSTDYLHMNWCEDGLGNGWFSGDNCTFSRYLNNVWTQTTFSSNRQDIINISPDN
jgi:hypothetical protein